MISIIIPAYNSASTIVEALDSVLAQTLWDVRRETLEVSRKTCGEVQYEVIIVDDCSKDNTVEVVRDWIKQYAPSHTSHISRFTLHALPANGGPAKARNKGIQEAHGDWIAFLDADDIWLPHKLELQMRLAAEHSEVAMWCGETIGFADEKELSSCQAAKVLSEGPSGSSSTTQQPNNPTTPILRAVPLEELALHNPIATSAVLVKREAVLAAGGFDPQFRGPEDYDLWLRVASLAETVIGSTRSAIGNSTAMGPGANNGATSIMHIKTPLSLYRRTVGSLSLDDRKFLPQVLRVLDKAYGAGGALEHLQHLRTGALSSQYWSGSWMAFSRGSRLDAIGLWWMAWRLNLQSIPGVKRPWFRMLIRYCCLPRPH